MSTKTKETVWKIISRKTAKLYRIVDGHGIVPSFKISRLFPGHRNKYVITMEKYEYDLENYIQDYQFKQRSQFQSLIDKLYGIIDKMHSLGIVHGDLHTANIVVNPPDDVRIIDFDAKYAQFIPKMDEYYCKNFWKRWVGEEEQPEDVTDIIQFEKTEWLTRF